MKRALICGISGQDGAYLASLLLAKGYAVFGTTRDVGVASFANLRRLGIFDRIQFESVALTDFRSVLQAMIKTDPDEIYNLAGQSSVALSFEQPVETMESIGIATLNLLEAIRFTGKPVKFYNAGSSECFGNTDSRAADESTPFRPRSPYAVAKAAAFWEVANYREAYGLFACSGVLFNHESPLRPGRYVTRKIVKAAIDQSRGRGEKLRLGNIKIRRDWGWAPEYVEAMWKMLQQERADDYVIATGRCNSLEAFIEQAFHCVGLDWRDHVEIDRSLFRPIDLEISYGNPAKARQVLGWEAHHSMQDVVRMMVQSELGHVEGAPVAS